MNNQITDDDELYNLIIDEKKRQKSGLELIASEMHLLTPSIVSKLHLMQLSLPCSTIPVLG